MPAAVPAPLFSPLRWSARGRLPAARTRSRGRARSRAGPGARDRPGRGVGARDPPGREPIIVLALESAPRDAQAVVAPLPAGLNPFLLESAPALRRTEVGR